MLKGPSPQGGVFFRRMPTRTHERRVSMFCLWAQLSSPPSHSAVPHFQLSEAQSALSESAQCVSQKHEKCIPPLIFICLHIYFLFYFLRTPWNWWVSYLLINKNSPSYFMSLSPFTQTCKCWWTVRSGWPSASGHEAHIQWLSFPSGNKSISICCFLHFGHQFCSLSVSFDSSIRAPALVLSKKGIRML